MTSSPSNPKRQITLKDNTELYDNWAKTYDSDGNVLQMMDALAFQDTVAPILQKAPAPLKILELGCGTGRNTVLLQKYAPTGSSIFATDISEGMMQEAKRKLSVLESEEGSKVSVKWALIDLQTQLKELQEFLTDGQKGDHKVDAVISTLVLEHVELNAFFGVVGSVLKPGGWAWVTDMHSEMGSSRAAYRRAEDGTKVSGVSFYHSIEGELASALKYGLELVGEVDERGPGDSEEDVVRKYGVRAKKWMGKRILCGVLFKKS